MTANRSPHRPHASLLDLDEDLSSLVPEERLLRARTELVVSLFRLPAEVWDASSFTSVAASHLGLLVVEGALARDVVIGNDASTELVGVGDFLRPWEFAPEETLVSHSIVWTVLDEARIAILDEGFAARLGHYPEVLALLLERLAARSRRLAVERAIAGLNRVDRRVLLLFWHLAERWGRVTTAGVVVPLTISHTMVGKMISARRPTVSTAIARLRETNELVRRDDGTWLLTGSPPDVSEETVARVLPRRRRFHQRREHTRNA